MPPGYPEGMSFAAIFFLVAAVLGFVGFFAPGWRYSLVSAAVGFGFLGMFVGALGA